MGYVAVDRFAVEVARSFDGLWEPLLLVRAAAR